MLFLESEWDGWQNHVGEMDFRMKWAWLKYEYTLNKEHLLNLIFDISKKKKTHKTNGLIY